MIENVLLFREALYGALIIALGCSVIGVYVVLRRIVFVGAALAELSSAGIALAIYLGGLGVVTGLSSHPLAFSLVVTLIGATLFGMGGGGRSVVPPDATIGAAYVLSAAAAILLIAKSTTGEAHDIFLHGNILGITRADNLVLAAVVLPVLLLHFVFFKEFLFVSFDRETARTLGYRIGLWNQLLYFTLGLVIAVAMQYAGVMLVFDFLVVPAVTGMLLTRTMRGLFAWAVSTALLAALIGFSISIPFDLPTGPAMIAVSGVMVLLAWLSRRVFLRPH